MIDPLGPPEAAAGMSLRLLLNPERVSRLVSQSAIDAALPSLEEVLDQLFKNTWQSTASRAGYAGEIARLVEKITLTHLLELTQNKEVTPQVNAVAMLKMQELNQWINARLLSKMATTDAKQRAHYLFAQNKLQNTQANHTETPLVTPLSPPDGQPIEPGYDWLAPACDWQR
ncbi:MAG: hypothetical protein EAZ14_06645 [Runella slithyformis]|nr:MAG: hypothetical protein EAZ14_06645 [Runella slithyformis]